MANVTATTFNYLGGQFSIGNGGNPESFTPISQIMDVDFSGSKVDTADVTSADNTDTWRRHKDELKDAGECTVQILWNPNDTTHVLLQTSFRNGGTYDFQRVNPGGFGTLSFSGIITSLDQKQQLDKPTQATCKIKISGAPSGS